MLVETVHNVSVTAKERLRALAIQRDALRSVMEEHPGLAQHIPKSCWYVSTALLPIFAESMAISQNAKNMIRLRNEAVAGLRPSRRVALNCHGRA